MNVTVLNGHPPTIGWGGVLCCVFAACRHSKSVTGSGISLALQVAMGLSILAATRLPLPAFASRGNHQTLRLAYPCLPPSAFARVYVYHSRLASHTNDTNNSDATTETNHTSTTVLPILPRNHY